MEGSRGRVTGPSRPVLMRDESCCSLDPDQPADHSRRDSLCSLAADPPSEERQGRPVQAGSARLRSSSLRSQESNNSSHQSDRSLVNDPGEAPWAQRARDAAASLLRSDSFRGTPPALSVLGMVEAPAADSPRSTQSAESLLPEVNPDDGALGATSTKSSKARGSTHFFSSVESFDSCSSAGSGFGTKVVPMASEVSWEVRLVDGAELRRYLHECCAEIMDGISDMLPKAGGGSAVEALLSDRLEAAIRRCLISTLQFARKAVEAEVEAARRLDASTATSARPVPSAPAVPRQPTGPRTGRPSLLDRTSSAGSPSANVAHSTNVTNSTGSQHGAQEPVLEPATSAGCGAARQGVGQWVATGVTREPAALSATGGASAGVGGAVSAPAAPTSQPSSAGAAPVPRRVVVGSATPWDGGSDAGTNEGSPISATSAIGSSQSSPVAPSGDLPRRPRSMRNMYNTTGHAIPLGTEDGLTSVGFSSFGCDHDVLASPSSLDDTGFSHPMGRTVRCLRRAVVEAQSPTSKGVQQEELMRKRFGGVAKGRLEAAAKLSKSLVRNSEADSVLQQLGLSTQPTPEGAAVAAWSKVDEGQLWETQEHEVRPATSDGSAGTRSALAVLSQPILPIIGRVPSGPSPLSALSENALPKYRA